MYLLSIGFLTRSWEKVVVYGYLPLSVYFVGQLYVFRFIQPWEINNFLFPDGRSDFFKLTPLLIFSMAITSSFLVKLIVDKVKSWWLVNMLLLIMFLNIIRLLVNNSFLPWWINMARFFEDLGLVIWIWWTGDYLSRINKKQKEIFWEYLRKTIKIVLIITSTLVLIQGIKGSPLGLVVEQSNTFPYFGVDTNELGAVPRPIGLMGDANNQGFRILTVLAAWVLLYVVAGGIDWKKQRWLVLPILAIIWLQSRAVYLGFFVLVLWWGYYGGFESIRKIKLGKWAWSFMTLIIIFVTVVLGVRFLGSVSTLGGNSGWETRLNLLKVSSRLISHYFLVGVGKGNFTEVAFREDLTGFMRTFPWPVHNGFILILVEQGISGLLLWVGLLSLLIYKLIKNNRYSLKIKSLVLSAIVAQFIVMFFQPFPEILNWLVIVAVLLLDDDKTDVKKA